MNLKKIMLIIAWCSVAYALPSELLIITHCFNRPDFIEWQFKSFKQFLRDNYEYVVFNDAQDIILEHQIQNVCKVLGVRCIRVPQTNRGRPSNSSLTVSSWRHSQAIAYSMHELGFNHSGLVMLIDSDMFLIKNFSVTDFLQNYDISGIQQVRGGMTYMWPGLMFFRMNSLPNKAVIGFSPCENDGTWADTGGALHYYLESNPGVKVLFFEQKYRLFLDQALKVYIWDSQLTRERKYQRCSSCQKAGKSCHHTKTILQELNFGNKILDCLEINQIPPLSEFVLNDTFFHYVASSNWDKKDNEFHEKKTKVFCEFMSVMLTNIV